MTTTLQLAITAIRSGRREEGRQLLNLLIQQNPNNELAWLWMSSVVDNDEQRARCLYHVLAVNPNNALARQGLSVLGIVVSDSRPVKVPRDSQPIKIQHPIQKPQTGPLKSLPAPQSPLARASERRPFRIDPQAVVEELPFTPARDPFSKPVVAAHIVNGMATAMNVTPPVHRAPDTNPLPNPSQSMPGVGQPMGRSQTEPMQSPSQPVTPVQPQSQAQTNETAQPVGHQPISDTGPFIAQQAHNVQNQQPLNQQNETQNMANSLPVSDTRPAQPVANQPMVGQPMAGQQNEQPYPFQGGHSSITMSMPTPQSQPMVPAHAQATMGMPMQPQQQMPVQSQMANGFMQYANTTMGMPMPNYLPIQPGQSSAALVNPMMMPMQQTQAPQQPNMMMPSPSSPAFPAAAMPSMPKHHPEEQEEEGMNILAVIVFGSLSITALGGLGMLILLIFTTG